jgi:hypothetical protein
MKIRSVVALQAWTISFAFADLCSRERGHSRRLSLLSFADMTNKKAESDERKWSVNKFGSPLF